MIVDQNGNARTIGIITSISYNVTFDVRPVDILGRFSAAELVTTGVEPVSINTQGWRIVDHGAYADLGYTNLRDLLTQEYIMLRCYDRQTKKQVATIRGCLPTGYSAGFSAKQLAELSSSFMGLLVDDETAVQAEAADAADLP